MITSLVAPKKDWLATMRHKRPVVQGVGIEPAARPPALLVRVPAPLSWRRRRPAKTARQQFIQASSSASAKDSRAPVESSVRGFVKSFQHHVATTANGALPTQRDRKST